MSVLPVNWKRNEPQQRVVCLMRWSSCNTVSVSRGRSLTRNRKAWKISLTQPLGRTRVRQSILSISYLAGSLANVNKNSTTQWLASKCKQWASLEAVHKCPGIYSRTVNTKMKESGTWWPTVVMINRSAVCQMWIWKSVWFQGIGKFSFTQHGNKRHWGV